MELTKEETKRIESECLAKLRERGFVPDEGTIVIKSGSLGIRTLGCVDFLSQCGYRIQWRSR